MELNRHAERELDKLSDAVLQRIVERLRALGENPFPRGSKKLRGGHGYRLRVGDDRVLHEVFKLDRRIVVYAVGHRPDVYR